MNQREARRRQQLIENTLAGLREILERNLHQELDPMQEHELGRLISVGIEWKVGRAW